MLPILVRLWLLLTFGLTLLSIDVDVLLLDEFLELMDLLAVHFDAHLVSSCYKVRMDLNLILTIITFFSLFLAFHALFLIVRFLSICCLGRCHLHLSLMTIGQDTSHLVSKVL